MSRAYAQPDDSAPPSVSSRGSPPKSKLKEKCPPDPKDSVEQLSSTLNKVFGYSNNAAIAVAAQVKEVATLTSMAPGVRQAAGCVLLVLETIGAMADNVAAFKQLASQGIDMYLTLMTCKEVIDAANADSPNTRRAHAELAEVADEFAAVMKHIDTSMKQLNARSKFRRYIFARADKNDLDKHRSAMAHMINKLQIVIGLANLAQTGEKNQIKQITEEDVRDTADLFRKRLVELAEAEHANQVMENYNSPNVNVTGSVNFNAGSNSNVYKSGNVNTKIISGFDDHSTHTNNIHVANGDFRGDLFGQRSRRDRALTGSDSDDSDGYNTPRARREERQRRQTGQDYYDGGRW